MADFDEGWVQEGGVTKTSVFFYGLFMDEDLLRGQGLTPENGRIAELRDHDIRIGLRAFVKAEPGMSLWGVMFDLPQDQVEQLYSGPGVSDYKPVSVQAHTRGGEVLEASCYNLSDGEAPREDDVYLDKLIEVCQRLEFPQDYLDRLNRL
jgi:hypothetical protein